MATPTSSLTSGEVTAESAVTLALSDLRRALDDCSRSSAPVELIGGRIDRLLRVNPELAEEVESAIESWAAETEAPPEVVAELNSRIRSSAEEHAPTSPRAGQSNPRMSPGRRAEKQRSRQQAARRVNKGLSKSAAQAPSQKVKTYPQGTGKLVKPGAIIEGRFELMERLGGETGFEVFKARDQRRHKHGKRPWVVIKLAPQHRADTLAHELGVAERLNHPGLVRVIDTGDWPEAGKSYLVREWIDGPTLAETLEGGRTWSVERTARFVAVIADALGYLHAKGYVYADLKPANIVLAENQRTVLLDLGSVVREGEVNEPASGVTAAFASPEALKGAFPDRRDDVYGLAQLAIRLLSGGTIRPGAPLPTIRGLSGPQRRVLAKALNPERPNRLGAVHDLAEALRPGARSSGRLWRGLLWVAVLGLVVMAGNVWLNSGPGQDATTARFPGAGASGAREQTGTRSAGEDTFPAVSSTAALTPPADPRPSDAEPVSEQDTGAQSASAGAAEGTENNARTYATDAAPGSSVDLIESTAPDTASGSGVPAAEFEEEALAEPGPAPAGFAFEARQVRVEEGAGAAFIYFTYPNTARGDAQFRVRPLDAMPDRDFMEPAVLSVELTDSGRSVLVVPIVDDALAEGTERFDVLLVTVPQSLDFPEASAIEVQIIDNDDQLIRIEN